MSVASRRKDRQPLPEHVARSPWRMAELYSGSNLVVPSVNEFVRSDRYLNRPNIYPRQMTLLRLIFLQTEEFTDYDWDVVHEWANRRAATEDHGVSADIEERIAWSKANGRLWFQTVVSRMGRRASKGWIGAVSGAYVLWHYVCRGDPQSYYGVDPDKRLAMPVFAGKKEQAKANQFADLYSMVTGAPCFSDYISQAQVDSLSVFAPHDFVRIAEREVREVEPGTDMASFIIEPKEATGLAGRGPAAFSQFYDELAHVPEVEGRSSTAVYDAASPALRQFRPDDFIYAGSSPASQIGQFYIEHRKAHRRVDDGTGKMVPEFPDHFEIALESWEPYKDWDRAYQLGYQRLRGPIQEYDEEAQRIERANPDWFAVEYRAKWASVLDAYLRAEKVDTMFDPWMDEVLTNRQVGMHGTNYVAHADPGAVNDRFGFAIGHVEPDPDSPEIKHAVFDVVTFWDPADTETHELDYEEVGDELFEYVKRFMPSQLTTDQWNAAGVLSRLRRKLREHRLPKRVFVSEVDKMHRGGKGNLSAGKLNLAVAETFKAALYHGRVHTPHVPVLEREAKFLQRKGDKVDHPDTGPVQSKDVWDAVSRVVFYLLGDQMGPFIAEDLRDLLPSAAMPGEMGFGPKPTSARPDTGANPFGGQFSGLHRRGQSSYVSVPRVGPGARRPRR